MVKVLVRLVILTDDLTGALDTGVQLSKAGIKTLVSLKVNFRSDYEVLVFDLKSRHLPRDDAYRLVFEAAREAFENGAGLVYKKVDSALRGNIGSELEALLHASGVNRLLFIPAYPKNNRITIGGVHWINGVKAAESIFAHDPFEPVRHSNVADIIFEQSSVNVETSVRKNGLEPVIEVLDAKNENDLLNIARNLSTNALPPALAGCAGFAAYLPKLLHLQKAETESINKSKSVLVISGSLNSTAIRQIQWAKNNGYRVFTLTREQKLTPEYWLNNENDNLISAIDSEMGRNGIVIVETVQEESDLFAETAGKSKTDLEKNRQLVQSNLAALTSLLLKKIKVDSLVVVGGDTLRGILENLGVEQIIPADEIAPGIVISQIKYYGNDLYLVSKSGGFGQEHTLGAIFSYLF